MNTIFISHSNLNDTEAIMVRDWLANQGWGDIFLDLDPATGIAPGQRWREELKRAGSRCSAVIGLLSPEWLASPECWSEYTFTVYLGKLIFPVLIAPCSMETLSPESFRKYQEIVANYQYADISTPLNREDGLERLRIGLQRAGLTLDSFRWPPEDEPHRPVFRGLRVLEEKDAAIFFGRPLQITKALDTIRQLRDGAPERMLVILGASGSGKSSFLRAGLLARLERDTLRFLVLPTFRPGRASLTGPTGLERVFGVGGPLDGKGITSRLNDLRTQAIKHRTRHIPISGDGDEVRPPTVILPIDQAEELFVAGDEEAAVAKTLIANTIKADLNLLLLITIRSDSFNLLQGDPILAEIPRLPFDLPRLPAAALKEIIEGPTRLAGAGIKIDEDLTDQLIQDFEGADSLPLLAFTLERLVADYGTDGQLEKKEYIEGMKGVGGAIRKAVEIAFAMAAEKPDLPPTRAKLDELAQRCFVPGLVRIDDAEAAPKRRLALRRDLPKEAQPLIDCFVDQRLLVTDEAEDERTVEVSHEAVLRHWPELVSWIKERKGELLLAEKVLTATREWQAAEGSDQKRGFLVHRGERLQAAEKLLLWDDLRKLMGDSSIAYLAACRNEETRVEAAKAAQQKRQRRLRQWISGLVAAAAIITLLGTVLVINGQRNLGRSQSLFFSRSAERFAEEGDYLRALRLSILATHDNWLVPTVPEAWAALSSNSQALKLLMEIRGHDGQVDGAVFSKDESRILTWSGDKTARLWDAATGAQIGPALQHDGQVSGAVFSNDESRILTWSGDKTARLWDAATGAQIGPALQHDDWVDGAVFSKDESRILTWSGDKTARLWDAATGAQIGPALQHDGQVSGAVFSKDESRILTWSGDKTARLWDAATGAQIGPALQHDGQVYGAVFSKDESRILTWSGDKTARLWDAATGAQIGPALQHDDWVDGAVFSKDESRILTWSGDKTARLWNAATGAQIGPALQHDDWVDGAVFSKDESRILTWSGDKTARLWDAATGAQIGPALQHDSGVSGAVFSKDESRILTWSWDKTARLWDAATGAQIGPALQHDGQVYGAVFSKDESRILTWSRDKTARLWDAATGAQIGPALQHDDWVYGAVFSKDESRILTWSGDKTARLWDAATGAQIGPALQHDGQVYGAVFSKDESRILTWSGDKTARLWDAATGAQIGPALQHDGQVDGAVFSKDESRILTWSLDKTARLWDAATGAQIGPALQHDGQVYGAVFSKDESRILTWSGDKTARLWDAATGAQIGPAPQHDDWVYGAVFSKDESRILTWSGDKTARLWDAATGAQIGPALQHDNWVYGAVFSKDESRILTWSGDKTARLWDAATGDQIGPALQHDGQVDGAVFSKDESRILTWSRDKTARLWDAATGAQIGPALQHDNWVYGAVFSKDESRILTWSGDKTARLWDVHWAMRDPTVLNFISGLCHEKLKGYSVLVKTTTSKEVSVGVRRIDEIDTKNAPILRGREGENVCDPPPTTWETLLSILRMQKR